MISRKSRGEANYAANIAMIAGHRGTWQIASRSAKYASWKDYVIGDKRSDRRPPQAQPFAAHPKPQKCPSLGPVTVHRTSPAHPSMLEHTASGS